MQHEVSRAQEQSVFEEGQNLLAGDPALTRGYESCSSFTCTALQRASALQEFKSLLGKSQVPYPRGGGFSSSREESPLQVHSLTQNTSFHKAFWGEKKDTDLPAQLKTGSRWKKFFLNRKKAEADGSKAYMYRVLHKTF